LTTEEQKAIIGGVVLEYAEVKQKIAALERDFSSMMDHVNYARATLSTSTPEQLDAYLAKWPTAEKIKATLDALKEAQNKRKELEGTIKTYGIDLP
jgi:predicted  nucleic acid-binding Zn-ribbon protein